MFNIDYTAVLTSIVSLIGGGWLFNLYSARPRKTSLEIDNMKEVLETMKESNRTYREDTDRTIRGLNKEIEDLKKNQKIKDDAIYSAYDCPFPAKPSDCIVLKVFKNCQNCNVETKIIADDEFNEDAAESNNA